LFRNKFINPRDQELALRDRQKLETYCDEMGRHLKALEAVKRDAAFEDFQSLLDQGAARNHDLVAARANLSQKERDAIAKVEARFLDLHAKAQGKTIEEVRA